MAVDLDQRQFFTQLGRVAFVRAEVDRLLEDERVVQAVELLLDRFRSRSALATSSLTEALRPCQTAARIP